MYTFLKLHLVFNAIECLISSLDFFIHQLITYIFARHLGCTFKDEPDQFGSISFDKQ